MNKIKFLKAVIYRIVSSCITVIISAAITGNFKFALSIGLFDTVFKIFNYYFFDAFWEKIFNKKPKPAVVWLTGLSGAGKTTIASKLIEKLKEKGIHYVSLDGDEIRNIIKQHGFDYESRKRHNMNVAYIASLFEKQGSIVIVSLISPYIEVRDECRKICGNFIETYVSTTLEECERRDVKGLYKKARSGEIEDFTGIDSPYEAPVLPEITLGTDGWTPEECADKVYKILMK